MSDEGRAEKRVYDRTTVSVSIDKKVEQKLREYCRNEGYSISRVAEKLFREWLMQKGERVEGEGPNLKVDSSRSSST